MAVKAGLPHNAPAADAVAVLKQSQQTAKEIEATFRTDAEGHLEAQVARMLDEPIAAARHVLLR